MASAKRLEDLQVWLLACELRDGIERLLTHRPSRDDADFGDQILRSSRSAAANVAEGFGHFKPRQFARYLRIARASLMETKNHIHAGRRQYFSAAEASALLSLTNRCVAAASRLIRYLDSCPPDLDLYAIERTEEPLNLEP